MECFKLFIVSLQTQIDKRCAKGITKMYFFISSWPHPWPFHNSDCQVSHYCKVINTTIFKSMTRVYMQILYYNTHACYFLTSSGAKICFYSFYLFYCKYALVLNQIELNSDFLSFLPRLDVTNYTFSLFLGQHPICENLPSFLIFPRPNLWFIMYVCAFCVQLHTVTNI